jgi:hypothetical protein
MLYGPDGSPVSGVGRNRMQVDGFRLPNGAMVLESESRKMHEKLKNDSNFRERVEQAQRDSYQLRHRKWIANGMQGPEPKINEIEHLAMLRHDNDALTVDKENALWKNVRFGEELQRERVKTEKEIEGSKAGYEKIAA